MQYPMDYPTLPNECLLIQLQTQYLDGIPDIQPTSIKMLYCWKKTHEL